MEQNLIFLPVLVQIALTCFLYVLLSNAKVAAFKAGDVDQERMKLHDDAWPDKVMQINNNINNQFQLPVLFYVLCVAIWALQMVNMIALGLASLFVLSRIVHCYVHVGSNHVPLRRQVFIGGMVLLWAMMLYVLAGIFGVVI